MVLPSNKTPTRMLNSIESYDYFESYCSMLGFRNAVVFSADASHEPKDRYSFSCATKIFRCYNATFSSQTSSL